MERVRIAVVGLRFGRSMVDSMLAAPGCQHLELVAICDKNPAVLEPIRQRTGLPAFTDMHQVLTDPTIQAIGLFTGPVGRAELIRQIIRAGKHVLTTKPFERDPEAALKVLREAKEYGKVVHMNSPGPELPADLRQVLAWQQQHDLGQIVAARFTTWNSYKEVADGSWYDDPVLCPVAPIYRLGIYQVNDCIRMLGPARKVHVLASRIATGRPTADNGQLSILFRNGAIANIFSSFCVNDGQCYRNSMTLNLQRGTIYRNEGPLSADKANCNTTMTLVTRDDELHPRTRLWNPSQKTVDITADSGNYQYEAFQRAVHGQPLRDEVTAEQIVDGIRVIAAMAKSEQSGCSECV